MRASNGSENEAAKGGLELLRWGVERMVFEPEGSNPKGKFHGVGSRDMPGRNRSQGTLSLGVEPRPQRETGPDPPA